MKDSPYQWFAMRATYKREFTAQEYLIGKGIEVYIPLRREIKVIRGIKRKVTVPAINSLIFEDLLFFWKNFRVPLVGMLIKPLSVIFFGRVTLKNI